MPQVVPEADAELGAGLGQPRKASRQSRPASLCVPLLIFRLVTQARMSFSEPLVWSRISGRSSTRSSSAYRELDDVLGLTTSGGGRLAEARTGKNGRHRLAGCCASRCSAGSPATRT